MSTKIQNQQYNVMRYVKEQHNIILNQDVETSSMDLITQTDHFPVNNRHRLKNGNQTNDKMTISHTSQTNLHLSSIALQCSIPVN